MVGRGDGHFGEDHRLARERLERCVALCEARGLPAIGRGPASCSAWPSSSSGTCRGHGLRSRTACPRGRSRRPLRYRRRAERLAGLAAGTGRPRAALRLAGAAAAYEETNQTYRPQNVRRVLDAWLAPVRATVGGAAAKLFEEGRGLTLVQAVALGLDDAPEDPWRAGPGAGLTRREREIAALVATGMTNREIAGKLYLSVRTVEVHVDHALTKLGFSTRGQLTVWAHEEGLMTDLRGEGT